MDGMKGLLALYRTMMLYKEMCRSNTLDLTFNELIIVCALNYRDHPLGSIHRQTLLDKGLIVRTLNALIKKGIVAKSKVTMGHNYFLTETGVDYLEEMYRDRDAIALSFSEKDMKFFEKLREDILVFEDKLHHYVLGSSSNKDS